MKPLGKNCYGDVFSKLFHPKFLFKFNFSLDHGFNQFKALPPYSHQLNVVERLSWWVLPNFLTFFEDYRIKTVSSQISFSIQFFIGSGLQSIWSIAPYSHLLMLRGCLGGCYIIFWHFPETHVQNEICYIHNFFLKFNFTFSGLKSIWSVVFLYSHQPVLVCATKCSDIFRRDCGNCVCMVPVGKALHHFTDQIKRLIKLCTELGRTVFTLLQISHKWKSGDVRNLAESLDIIMHK